MSDYENVIKTLMAKVPSLTWGDVEITVTVFDNITPPITRVVLKAKGVEIFNDTVRYPSQENIANQLLEVINQTSVAKLTYLITGQAWKVVKSGGPLTMEKDLNDLAMDGYVVYKILDDLTIIAHAKSIEVNIISSQNWLTINNKG